MSAEEKAIRQSPTAALTYGTARADPEHADIASARCPTLLPGGAEGLWLRVFWPREGEYHADDSRRFPLTPDHWQRLEIPLPADWHGRGLRLDPGGNFGLLEIAGVRIVASVMGRPLWELLGEDLIAGVRVTAGAQPVSGSRRLRLLCTGDDAQIWLPDVALAGIEEPLVLEVGLRVRTEPAAIGYALQEWVEGAHGRLREALRESTTAEAARARGEKDMAILLAEVEAARADGNRREAALREQLATAHQTAQAHAATLTAEIESARAYGEERAVALTAEIEAARADGNRREAALREQLATAHQIAQAHAATLTAEIESARAYGEERAVALTSALETARADGEQRAAELHEEKSRWQQDQAALQQELQALAAIRLMTGQRHTGTPTAPAGLRTVLAEARRAAEADQGRIRSMQQSFSWRITLPLRVIKRLLTGRRPARR